MTKKHTLKALLIVVALLALGGFVLPSRAAGTLMLHLPFDEAAGAATFSDASGNGHDITCTGATCPTAGVSGAVGTAVEFGSADGTPDYLELPYQAAFNPLGSFTVAAWVKVTGGAGSYRSVITSRDGSASTGYILYATDLNTWQFWLGTGSTWAIAGSHSVSLDTWTHLAGVYDASTQTMQLYVNGELVGTQSGIALAPNTQWPLRIGAGATEGAPQFHFPGQLDDVRLYTHALTEAEIQALVPPSVYVFNDAYTVRGDRVLSMPAPGVLGNDYTVRCTGALTATLLAPPGAGTLVFAPDGGFTYTPTLELPGTYTFTYQMEATTVTDLTAMTGTATVTLTVTPVAAPVANDDHFHTIEGVPIPTQEASSLTTLFSPWVGSSNRVMAGNMFDVTAGSKNIHITGFDINLHTPVSIAVYYKAGSYVGAERNPEAWTLLGTGDADWQQVGNPSPLPIGGLTIPAGKTYGLYVTGLSEHHLYYTHGNGVYSNEELTLTTGTGNFYLFDSAYSGYTWNGTIHYYTSENVLFNDSDADGDDLVASLRVGATHGDLALNVNGSFVYTPTFVGDDTFTYVASDSVLTDTATVTITVGVNDPPTAVDDTYTTVDYTFLTVPAPGLLANDSDPNGYALTAGLFAAPHSGIATVNPDGSFTYTPVGGYIGTDTFTYLASDGVVTSTATVTITVEDALTLYLPFEESSGATLFADLSGYGHDAACSGAACPTAEAAGVPGLGAAPYRALHFDGSSNYVEVPHTTRLNPESFTVMAWVNLSGGSGNHRSPLTSRDGDLNQGYMFYAAPNDVWQFWLGTGSGGWASLGTQGVVYNRWTHLAGVYDASTQTMQFYVNGAQDGSVSVPFAPNAARPLRVGAGATEGAATFFFPGRIDDVRLYARAFTGNEIATLAASVYATGDTYSVREGKVLAVAAPGVLDNDLLSGSSGTLTATLTTSPAHGDLVQQLDGGFTYTPTVGFTGTDIFTYTAHYGENAGTAAVTITVLTNLAPVAGDDAYTTREDIPLTVAAPGVLDNDSDPHGDTLTATLATAPLNGVAMVQVDGSFTYTPTTGFSGEDIFHYEASDGTLLDMGAVMITVIPNYAPVAGDDAYNAIQGIPLSANVLDNDADANGDSLTATLQTGPAHGDLVLHTDGSFVYTATHTFQGEVTFTYLASDGALADSATVTFTVSANQPPVAGDDTYTVYRNIALTVPAPGLLSNDSDPEGIPLSAALLQPPATGSAMVNPAGSFTYTPTLDFTGMDTFSYVVDDGLFTATARVTLTVIPLPCQVEVNGDTIADYASSDASALQEAVNNASPGALIRVAGTCAGVQYQGYNYQTLYLDKALTLQGGYTAEDWSLGPDPETYTTTLDAQGQGRVVMGAYGADVTLAGFVLTGGNTPSYHSGGGIYISGGTTLTLTHATVTGNTAYSAGGGIYNAGTLVVMHTLLSSNRATFSNGGGLYNSQASPALTNVTFSNNTAQTGGGIYNYGDRGSSSPTLTDVTFNGNAALGNGGGMYNNGDGGTSSPTLTDVTFSGNSAGADGGGMYNNGTYGTSSPTLTDVTFSANSAGKYGGGMYNSGYSGTCRPSLNRVTFANNSATFTGGAIYLYAPSSSGELGATVVNSLFHTNGSAHIGYQGQNVATQPHFINCTFSGALSRTLQVDGFSSGQPLIAFTNSIFWNNNGDITNEDAALNVQYSIVEESGYSGTGNRFADPRFVDAAGGNLRLRQGSPAIDMGDETLLPAGITTDLDGFTRNVGNTVDMGAYESQYEEICEFSEGTHILGLVRPITLTFATFEDLGDLFCLTVTYFPASHPNATLPLQNGVFWTISGKDWEDNPVTSGFTATLTLPFAQAAGTSRACRWLEGVGPGAGWDCDSTHTTHSPNASVTRSQIHAFSDWAVGNDAGPTSVSLVNFAMRRATLWVYATGIIVLVGLLSAKGGLEARTRRHIRRNLGRYPARK